VFKPDQGRRYDMPVVFGPSPLGGRATYASRRAISYSFLTDPALLEPLIPYHFRLAEPATVIVHSSMLIGVDWLAGRNYHTARVSVQVEAKDGGEVLRGPFHLVDWESEPRAVIAGREYLGLAKIVGEIPEHEQSGDRTAFECYEYGTRLLRVEVSNLRQITEEELDRRNSGGDFVTLGWKYIPGPGGAVDVDYPVKMVSRGRADAMWTGDGSVAFDEPTWEQCPTSARIMPALAGLPVLESLPATVVTAVGGILDRAASARLV
jgi:Acetoacetate decarboxylase (ADC)